MKRTLITLAMTLSVAAPAMADLALATSKNCMACHAMQKKIIGAVRNYLRREQYPRSRGIRFKPLTKQPVHVQSKQSSSSVW